MSEIPNAKRFADVADALKIANPAIVEKDYFAVKLLALLELVAQSHYRFVFAGRTCLSKVHLNTYRMSEDLDFKLVPSSTILELSRSSQRRMRSQLNAEIQRIIDSSSVFTLVGPAIKHSEGRFQQFLVDYPKSFEALEHIRPHLQLEFTESSQMQEPIIRPISSLYNQVAGHPGEIREFPCVPLETIASEKLVSLLRRTAAVCRDSSKVDDETLIRHAYDLHIIKTANPDLALVSELTSKVIETDQ